MNIHTYAYNSTMNIHSMNIHKHIYNSTINIHEIPYDRNCIIIRNTLQSCLERILLRIEENIIYIYISIVLLLLFYGIPYDRVLREPCCA